MHSASRACQRTATRWAASRAAMHGGTCQACGSACLRLPACHGHTCQGEHQLDSVLLRQIQNVVQRLQTMATFQAYACVQ